MDEDLEAYRKYLINAEKSETTVKKYLRDVRRFLTFVQSRGMGEVTKETVMEYKRELALAYLPSSINSMLAALNSYLSYCGRPQCRVRLMRIQRRVFSDGDKQLEREEYISLVKEARAEGNERLALIMETVCGTGIRISELDFITVEAVKDGYAKVSLKGKERVVLIPERLTEKLSGYCRERSVKSGCVFITRTGRPVNRSNVWREMHLLCKKAGVSEEKVFPHNMRHLFARTYYTKQKDIVHLADILGHSSIETTRIYTMESSREYEKEINGMELIM